MSEFSESVSPREISLGEEFKPFVGMEDKIREISARNAVGDYLNISSEVLIEGKEIVIQAFAPEELNEGGGLGYYTPFPEATFRAFSARPGETSKFSKIYYLTQESHDPESVGLRFKITFDGLDDEVEGYMKDQGGDESFGHTDIFNGERMNLPFDTIIPSSPELLKRIKFTFFES